MEFVIGVDTLPTSEPRITLNGVCLHFHFPCFEFQLDFPAISSNMRRVLFHAIAAASLATTCCAQNATFTTLVSSPFTLILRPTFQNLDLEAILMVQDAISATLHRAVGRNVTYSPSFGSLQAIVQQVHWLAGKVYNSSFDAGASFPETTFQFTVVAHFVTMYSSLPSLSELDSFILTTLASQLYQTKFQKLLVAAKNPLLKDAVPVDVTTSSPTTDPSSKPGAATESRLVSNVDILLLAISGCILFGVVYMIYRHHFDQGYIETERMRYFSRPAPTASSYSSTALQFHGCHSSAAVDYVVNNQKQVVAPQTPSTADKQDDPVTPSTADIALDSPEHNFRPPTPVNTPSPDMSNHHRITPKVDSTEPDSNPSKTIPEVFASTWFKSQEAQYVDAEAEGYHVSSDSDELDDDNDIFQMDVAQMSPLSQDSSQPPRPTAKKTLLSEWMKGIRVVSSDKTSETTIHSIDRSSAVESPLEARSVKSNQERYAFEYSMARSTVVVETPPKHQLEI